MFFSLVLVLVLIYTSVSMFIFIALQFVIVAIYHTVYCMPLLVHKFYKINITLWSSHVMQKMIFHPVIILFIENAIENSILQYFSNKVAIFRPKMGVEKRLFQYFWVFFLNPTQRKFTLNRVYIEIWLQSFDWIRKLKVLWETRVVAQQNTIHSAAFCNFISHLCK